MIRGGFTLIDAADGFTVTLSYMQIIIMVLTVVLMVGFTC